MLMKFCFSKHCALGALAQTQRLAMPMTKPTRCLGIADHAAGSRPHALDDRAAGDAGGARATVTRLHEVVRGDPAAERLVRLLSADIEMAAGDAAAALGALANLPGDTAVRRPELVLRAQALLRVGRPAEVTGALQTWVAGHPEDATVWQLLASNWQAQGQPLRAVRAEAEARAAHYDYAAAVDRFKAGQDLARRGGPQVDHIEASIIDTRLKVVESLLREQAAER